MSCVRVSDVPLSFLGHTANNKLDRWVGHATMDRIQCPSVYCAHDVARTAPGTLIPFFSEDDNIDFEGFMQTNVMGVYVTKAVANHMQRHKINGPIVNIGSTNADKCPYKERTAYAARNGAVIHMAKPLVTKRSHYKIRINLGPVQSGFLGFPNNHNPDFQKDKIPAAFIAEPSDLDGLMDRRWL